MALPVMMAAPSGPIFTPAPRAWSFSTQLPSFTVPRVTLGGVGISTLMLLSHQKMCFVASSYIEEAPLLHRR